MKTNKSLLLLVLIAVLACAFAGCAPLDYKTVSEKYKSRDYKIEELSPESLRVFEGAHTLGEENIKYAFSATLGAGLFPSGAKVYICRNAETAKTIEALYKTSTNLKEKVSRRQNAVAVGTEAAVKVL